MFKNKRFESLLLIDLDLKSLSKHFFLYGNGNYKLQAWMPYINHLHDDEPSWHIFVDSIVLDTFHGLVELLTSMTKLNKYVFDPSLVSFIKLDLKDFLLNIPF
jgi:hypothetical protein